MGWAVYQRLQRSRAASYVDADRLACPPESAKRPCYGTYEDPQCRGTQRKLRGCGRNLLRCLGVVDPVRGPGRDVVGDPLTVVRMTVDDAGLTRRLDGRRGSFGRAPDAIPLAAAPRRERLRRTLPDTGNRSVRGCATRFGMDRMPTEMVPTTRASAGAALIRPPNSAVGEVLLCAGRRASASRPSVSRATSNSPGWNAAPPTSTPTSSRFFDAEHRRSASRESCRRRGNYFDGGVPHLVVAAGSMTRIRSYVPPCIRDSQARRLSSRTERR